MIGGGILGIATAWSLSTLGRRVILLERGFVGNEATSLSAGTLYSAGWGNSPSLLTPTLTEGSMRLYGSLGDVDLARSGALETVLEPHYVDRARAVARREAEEHGLDVRYVEGRELWALEPRLAGSEVLGAVYTRRSGHVDPAKAVHAMAEMAESAGTVIAEGRDVVSIERVGGGGSGGVGGGGSGGGSGGGYLVTAMEKGTKWNVAVYRAEHVVVAGGAWCRRLGAMLGLDVPVIPVKGQMWATAPTERPEDDLSKVIWTFGSHEYWKQHPTRDDARRMPDNVTHDHRRRRLVHHGYGRQCADGRIIFGGDRIPCADTDYQVEDESIAVNRELAGRIMPHLAPAGTGTGKGKAAGQDGNTRQGLEIEGSWAGIMPFSLDGNPLIGPLGKVGHPNLWMAGGLGPSGMMLGPMAGWLLGRWIHDTMGSSSSSSSSSSSTSSDAKRSAAKMGPNLEASCPYPLTPSTVLQLADPCRADGGISRLPSRSGQP